MGAAEDYLLRQLLYCERCGARMQGTRGSRAQHRRYQCGTRRRGGDCTQRIVTAEPLEQQLVDWLRGSHPGSGRQPGGCVGDGLTERQANRCEQARTDANEPEENRRCAVPRRSQRSRPGSACSLGVMHADHYTRLMKTIQVRNVPDDVHRALRTRAASAGVSLSDFALGELERAAQRPPVAELLQRARSRAGGASSRAIVAAVRSGRDRA